MNEDELPSRLSGWHDCFLTGRSRFRLTFHTMANKTFYVGFLVPRSKCWDGTIIQVDFVWNVMAHGDARGEKWRGNNRMEWVTSKRHMTAEHRLARAVQTLQADVHSSPASSRMNWRPRRFKWNRTFRRKTKSGFCACATTFQTLSTASTYRVLDCGGKRLHNTAPIYHTARCRITHVTYFWYHNKEALHKHLCSVKTNKKGVILI